MTTPQLNAALAKAQAEFEAVAKNKTADAGKYSYRYADLASIAGTAYPILGKNGLAFSAQPTMSDGHFVLQYALLHESGEERGGELPLPMPDGQASWQQMGIAISYARRYAFGAVTGIVTEEDTDGQGAPAPERRQRAQPQRDFPGPTRVSKPSSESEDEVPLLYDRKRKRMFALFSEIGLTDRDAQLAFIGSVLERDMTTRRDMTIEDYDKVIPELVAERRTQQQPEPDGPLVPQGVNAETGEVEDPWGANKP